MTAIARVAFIAPVGGEAITFIGPGGSTAFDVTLDAGYYRLVRRSTGKLELRVPVSNVAWDVHDEPAAPTKAR